MARAKRRGLWGIAALLLLFVLTLGTAVACSGETEKNEQNEQEEETPVYVVTFYDGETVIATDNVQSGGKASEFESKDKD